MEEVKNLKKQKKSTSTLLRLALLAVVSLGVGSVALATGGTSTDPLITLSYLQETVLPALTAEGKTQGEVAVAAAEAKLDSAIAELKADLQSTGVGNSSAGFSLLTLSQGQSIKLDLGTQLVLRIGSATVTATSTPALVNLTQGTSILSGTSLTVNQLYLSTITDRSITATADTVKLMISGGYELLG